MKVTLYAPAESSSWHHPIRVIVEKMPPSIYLSCIAS
jgi:hypothetical protein